MGSMLVNGEWDCQKSEHVVVLEVKVEGLVAGGGRSIGSKVRAVHGVMQVIEPSHT